MYAASKWKIVPLPLQIYTRGVCISPLDLVYFAVIQFYLLRNARSGDAMWYDLMP